MLVDAHAHIWGPELLGVHWLQAPAAAGIRRPFGIELLERELERVGVARAVLVSADETDAGNQRLLAVASRSTRVGAVVAWAGLGDPRMTESVGRLQAATGGGRLRGVRVSAGGIGSERWGSREVIAGLAAVRDAGLVVEVLTDEVALPAVAAVCRRLPGLVAVVDHLGGPAAGAGARWRDGIRELAGVEGTHLKVSGAAVAADDFPAMLEFVRDAFGPTRLMAGSDWPVSTLLGGRAWQRVLAEASAWSSDERAQLGGATAARVYGIAA